MRDFHGTSGHTFVVTELSNQDNKFELEVMTLFLKNLPIDSVALFIDSDMHLSNTFELYLLLFYYIIII